MRQGQGLLETIVAIGVITTGLVSVISLVISNLTTQRESAMRYQAVNLAREGIELVRNTRDSNWLDSSKENAWVGLAEAGDVVVPVFNPTISGTVSFVSYSGGSESAIQQCANGFYAQNSSNCTGVTPFERVLTLAFHSCNDIFPAPDDTCGAAFGESGVGDIALGVTSTVTWKDQGRQREVKLNETLYDWK